jgi:hypothetical protein
MRLVVRDVVVTEKGGLGKATDNYNLRDSQDDDCWAADYMNEAKAGEFHPFVEEGQHFCAVGGLFEQYTGGRFDYYQLITLTTADLAICGDGDSDGDVDLDDMPRFAECLAGPACDSAPDGCDLPVWTQTPPDLDVQHCLMMDLDYDGDADLFDFGGLQDVFGFAIPLNRR